MPESIIDLCCVDCANLQEGQEVSDDAVGIMFSVYPGDKEASYLPSCFECIRDEFGSDLENVEALRLRGRHLLRLKEDLR